MSNWPSGKFKVVYADPPWMHFGDPNKSQAAGKHYAMMDTDEIGALPVMDLVDRPGACFLWATGPRLHFAVKVMEQWGFHFRGVAYVWVKTRKSDGGIVGGRGVRPTFVKPSTEFVLAGSTCKTGRPIPIQTEAQHQVVLAPIRQHSVKPVEVRQRIEELFGDVPMVELFARERTPGWAAWGQELK